MGLAILLSVKKQEEYKNEIKISSHQFPVGI